MRRSVGETSLGLSHLCTMGTLRAIAVAAEAAKFPGDPKIASAGPKPQGSNRRQFVASLPLLDEQAVPAWAVWIWKTVGVLMPVVLVAIPMFLIIACLEKLHSTMGHKAVLACAPFLVAALMAWLLIEIALLRLALFPQRVEPGRYMLNRSMHLRFCMLDVSLTFLRRFGGIYHGTPVHNCLLRALGANIGYGAMLSFEPRASLQLLQVGSGCTVKGHVQCHIFMDGELVLAPVELAEGVQVKTACALEPGVFMGRGASLRPMSVLPLGWSVPAGLACGGVPAVALDKAESTWEESQACVDWLKLTYVLLMHPYVFVALLYLALLVWIAVWRALGAGLGVQGLFALMLGVVPAFWFAGSVALGLFVLFRWVLVGKIRPGQMPAMQYSNFRWLNFMLSSSFPIWIQSLPAWVVRTLFGACSFTACSLPIARWVVLKLHICRFGFSASFFSGLLH